MGQTAGRVMGHPIEDLRFQTMDQRCPIGMVLFLVLNIGHGAFQLFSTQRKDAVFFLPSKLLPRDNPVDLVRAATLELAHKFRDRVFGWNRDNQLDMIRHTTDRVEWRFQGFGLVLNVLIKFRFQSIGNQRLALIRRPNQVVIGVPNSHAKILGRATISKWPVRTRESPSYPKIDAIFTKIPKNVGVDPRSASQPARS